MRHLNLCILFLLVVNSCGPKVTFNAPQPEGKTNLASFPNHLLGEYLGDSGSSRLLVFNDLIVRSYNGDSLPLPLDSSQAKSQNPGFVDTVFYLSEKSVLRKWKGYYFLNQEYEPGQWGVKKLQLTKGKLIISEISEVDDLENLKSITETANDTVSPFHFAPTKKQFKAYLKSGGFAHSEVYIRLNQ